MRTWRELVVCMAVLVVEGCGSGGSKATGSGSSEEPNLRRCQATCTLFCASPTGEGCNTPQMPCGGGVDGCVNICLGTTDGLDAVCAQCVAAGPITYAPECLPRFKSPASAECLPLCSGQAVDAAAK
jgi:hypothetical protein